MDEILRQIMETFEQLLDEYNISIPSEDREGLEDEARIYGSEYYELEDKIRRILNNE